MQFCDAPPAPGGPETLGTGKEIARVMDVMCKSEPEVCVLTSEREPVHPCASPCIPVQQCAYLGAASTGTLWPDGPGVACACACAYVCLRLRPFSPAVRG